MYTSLAHFINDGTVALVPLVGAVFAVRAVPPLVIGMMFIVFNASSAVLSIYVGAIADRTGKPGPMIGMGLGLLSLGILGFSGILVYGNGVGLAVLLGLSAFIAGFGNAFIHPLMATVLQHSYNGREVGNALGVNGAIGSIGRALYPSLYFLVVALLTEDGSVSFFALLGIAVSFLVWVGLRQWSQSKTSSNPPKVGYRAKDLVSRSLVILIVAAFVRNLAVGGIVSWIPTYISIQRGTGITGALGLSITTMYAGAIIGQPIFGLFVNRFDKRIVMGLSSVLSGLSIFGYLFTSGFLAVCLLFIFGFFSLSIFPLFPSLATDYVPREAFSIGNGLVWGLGVTGGQAIGPGIITAIMVSNYDRLGFAFEVMVLIFLASVLFTALIPKPERKVPATLLH